MDSRTPSSPSGESGSASGTSRCSTGSTSTLCAGEVLVLAGANGAGKSTLVKILAGVYDDWEGEMALDGARIRAPAQPPRRRRASASRASTRSWPSSGP